MNRRQLLCTTRLVLVGGAVGHAGGLQGPSDAKSHLKPLILVDFEPKSMLEVLRVPGIRSDRLLKAGFALAEIGK